MWMSESVIYVTKEHWIEQIEADRCGANILPKSPLTYLESRHCFRCRLDQFSKCICIVWIPIIRNDGTNKISVLTLLKYPTSRQLTARSQSYLKTYIYIYIYLSFVSLKLSSPCQRNPPNLLAPSCPRKNLCLQTRDCCVLPSTQNDLTCLSLHHQLPSKCWCHKLYRNTFLGFRSIVNL